MPAHALAPALLPLTAVPVPQEARLAYVLQHFRLAYYNVPPVTIGYASTQPAITIAEGSGDFFQQNSPYPPAPLLREWLGQQVPFFFDNQPGTALLEFGEVQVTINADIISTAFYLLSGWQEYFSTARDQHGRFPYAASVQKQFGFVALPLVNYYFDVLKTAVEHVSGQQLTPRRWNGAPFAGFITHDIDSLHGGWGTAARHLLGQGRLPGLLALLGAKLLRRPAPWNNLEQVQAETAQFGAASTFFILGDHRPAATGTANADYHASDPELQARLHRLVANGAEIASHASYGTATKPEKLNQELKQLEQYPARGNRFHYLCWEPRQTPDVVAQAGLAYDSTLGFAEHFGFRNSYCLPFYPFDFARAQAHPFLEIPLNVMDATLHHPQYLQLRPAEVLPALLPMLDEIEKFGGVATVLWHNANFDPANTLNGPQQFLELMTHLRRRGAAFLTSREICQQLSA